MNNEPLELARRQPAGPGGRNPRPGEEAERAVLMIDPFPGETGFTLEHEAPADLFGLFIVLFSAMKNQSRFKPDELMLAAHSDNYSRFMIAPKRGDAAHPLACGGLGGFGGFLEHAFRSHDFFLGRRNAQRFLKRHFVLPENNPLFAEGWSDALKEAHCVRAPDGGAERREGQRLLPIIPVVDAAGEECMAPEWPRYSTAELDGLRKSVERRAGKVMQGLVDQYFDNVLIRRGVRLLVFFKKNELARWVAATAAADLQKMGLMR